MVRHRLASKAIAGKIVRSNVDLLCHKGNHRGRDRAEDANQRHTRMTKGTKLQGETELVVILAPIPDQVEVVRLKGVEAGQAVPVVRKG